MQNLITSTYEHALAYALHKIDKRGLLIDHIQLEEVRKGVNDELTDICKYLSGFWSFPVYIGRENYIKDEKALNLNTPKKVLDKLKDLGYKVPKVRMKDQETHEYEWEESVNELALRQLLANPLWWPNPNAGDGIKKLLEGKELITFRNRYVNARLYKNQYFSNHNVAGSVTGRRGSKKNLFGYGGNDQNFPARGRLSDLWRKAIIARENRIFLFVDQMSAEDWPVQALAENHAALDEMRQGVNRHYKFASIIFNKPIDLLKSGRASGNHECEMEYYLGKKGRHANNYGMQPARLSEALAGEGYTIPVETTKYILDVINRIDPNVKSIFHEYVKNEISKPERKLVTPLGRERQFFGLRQNDKNYTIFNEAFSYIPQSTVGDNTGLAILYLDGVNTFVLQDGHDSIVQEVPDYEQPLIRTFQDTKQSFNRTIKFHNGIEIEIPIEGKLGYDWHNTVEIKPFTEDGLLTAYKKVKELRQQEQDKQKNATTATEVMA